MKILVIIIAATAIAVIASISFFSQIEYNKPPCTFCPSIPSPNQTLQVLDNKTAEAKFVVTQGSSQVTQYYDGSTVKPKVELYDYYYDGIGKDNGTVSINNKTYYQTTLNYADYDLKKGTSIQFQNVTFAFPEGTMNTPGGSFIMLDIKFQDGYEEIYGENKKNPDGSGAMGGIAIPTQYGPHLATNSTTVLGNHTMPQAGMTIYNDKIKLLVSKIPQLSQQLATACTAGPGMSCNNRPVTMSQNDRTNSIFNSTYSNGPEFKVGPDLLGPIPHQLVFFMKSNSTAKIFVEYTSNEPNTGTVPSYSSVYVGKEGNFTPLTTSDVTIIADPPSIPQNEGSDTTVVYTVTAKEGVKGVYWISLVQFCRVMPLAVDINSLTISPFDIPVQTGIMHCPAQFLDGKILGISGGTAEYKIGQPVH